MTGIQFKKLLGALNLTQEEAAEMLGVKRRNTIGDWCKLAQLDEENVQNIRTKLSKLPDFEALYSVIIGGQNVKSAAKSEKASSSDEAEILSAAYKLIKRVFSLSDGKEDLENYRDKMAVTVDGIRKDMEEMEGEMKKVITAEIKAQLKEITKSGAQLH